MQSILIVEDEEIIRTSLSKLLTREGFEVSNARHIDDALQKYQINNFSLIISDLRLPGAKGTKLIDMVSEVPVLIMTSYASLRSAVDTMRMGAVDYIAKPYDHGEMITAVRRILNNQEQTTDNTAPPTEPPQLTQSMADKELPENLSLEDYFTRFVQENQHNMSETELARKLGISRKCLWERRQKLGIPRRQINN